MAESFEVVFYEDDGGGYPVEDFILSQNIKMRAKIFRMIELLETWGSDLREPYSKHLEDGIFELRIKLGSDITRVLYFFVVQKRIVLTNAFIKKTRKTPSNEINLAKRRRENYIARKDEEI